MTISSATEDHPKPHPAHVGMRSTLIGIRINIFLSAGKGAAGILGNSYALVADAIESSMDVVSSIVVFVGLRMSARPADENHRHGHGKAEPLAALAVALFLLLAAFSICRESISEIRTPHTLPASWTLLVLIGVVFIKETLFRFVIKVGEEVGSSAVKGDAWHHRNDALTSVAAFPGISTALIGSHFSPDPRWSTADDWAASFASVIIVINGLSIMRTAVHELTDARRHSGVEKQVRRIALAVPGVEGLDKCFIRKMEFDTSLNWTFE